VGLNNKPFRVLGLEINEDLTVNVQLFEHQDNFYTFNEKNPIPTIADTILPNPNSVQAPSIDSVSDEVIELFDGSVVSKLVLIYQIQILLLMSLKFNTKNQMQRIID
jgi:hypothetical protein